MILNIVWLVQELTHVLWLVQIVRRVIVQVLIEKVCYNRNVCIQVVTDVRGREVLSHEMFIIKASVLYEFKFGMRVLLSLRFKIMERRGG